MTGNTATRASKSSFGVLSVLRQAWAEYPSRALPLLALLLGWVLVWVVTEFLVISTRTSPGRPVWILLHLGYFWGTAYWEAAMVRSALNSSDQRWVALRRVFHSHRDALGFFVLKLVLIPMTLVGLALLVIPGLVVVARFGLSFLFVVDSSEGPWAALASSRATTRGVTTRIMLLCLVFFLFNLGGAAILGLGLMLTVPMTVLAGAHVYRSLVGSAFPAE